MLGIDSNILLRYITGDDPEQSELARQTIDRAAGGGELLHICVPVLCELAWVLRSKPYAYGREEIADTIELLLEVDILDMEARDTVRAAVRDFRAGNADFADYLIGRINRSGGCRTTLTFDVAAAANTDLFEVVKA